MTVTAGVETLPKEEVLMQAVLPHHVPVQPAPADAAEPAAATKITNITQLPSIWGLEQKHRMADRRPAPTR
jgi:hypothetical protein